MANLDDNEVRCRVHTRASLPRYNSWSYNERCPGDVDTVARAWGDSPRDRDIAGRMAGEIGHGQSSAAWDYLRSVRFSSDDER